MLSFGLQIRIRMTGLTKGMFDRHLSKYLITKKQCEKGTSPKSARAYVMDVKDAALLFCTSRDHVEWRTRGTGSEL